jgi:hypothetical protein
MRCDGDNFHICDHQKWINMQCSPGTSCKQKGDFILCDWK